MNNQATNTTYLYRNYHSTSKNALPPPLPFLHRLKITCAKGNRARDSINDESISHLTVTIKWDPLLRLKFSSKPSNLFGLYPTRLPLVVARNSQTLTPIQSSSARVEKQHFLPRPGSHKASRSATSFVAQIGLWLQTMVISFNFKDLKKNKNIRIS